MKELLESLRGLHRHGTPHVMVTLLATRGEAPSFVGAKAVISDCGLVAGTIGGGKVESRVITHAKEWLLDNEKIPPQIITWNLQTDIGMTCGGECTFLFEKFRPQSWEIAVFGAGHVSQALVRALLNLDCRVHCFDSRQEWIDRLPVSDQLVAKVVAVPAEVVACLKPGTFFVIMTQGHATDVPVLAELYAHHAEIAYVGAIGSDLKARKLKSELAAKGISAGRLDSLRCPVGLPIGNNSPAEIAISICAELIQVRDRRRSIV